MLKLWVVSVLLPEGRDRQHARAHKRRTRTHSRAPAMDTANGSASASAHMRHAPSRARTARGTGRRAVGSSYTETHKISNAEEHVEP